MSKLRVGVLTLLALSASSLYGATVSFQGSFSEDDDLEAFNLIVLNPTTVTMRTWSFAGGVNGEGTVIPDGGFVPILSLFDVNTGLLLQTDFGGAIPCGPRATDPTTGACWDSYMSLSLGAGSYRLVLTQDDNTAIGPFLSDGFQREGQGNFTGPNFLGTDGSFVMIGGFQRTADWAVDITDADIVERVPEPATAGFAALAVGAAYLARRRAVRH